MKLSKVRRESSGAPPRSPDSLRSSWPDAMEGDLISLVMLGIAIEAVGVVRGASLARRWAAGSRPRVLRTPMETRSTSPASER